MNYQVRYAPELDDILRIEVVLQDGTHMTFGIDQRGRDQFTRIVVKDDSYYSQERIQERLMALEQRRDEIISSIYEHPDGSLYYRRQHKIDLENLEDLIYEHLAMLRSDIPL